MSSPKNTVCVEKLSKDGTKTKGVNVILPSGVETTVQEFKVLAAKGFGLTDTSRVKLSIKDETGGNKHLTMSLTTKKLSQYGATEKSVFVIGDLGRQINYRFVFIAEYLGPIVLMLLLASRPAFIFGSEAASLPWNPVALAAVGAYAGHFAKRILESIFVHKFSHETMPFSQLFVNTGYYYFFAVLIGWGLCHPSFTSPGIEAVAVGGALMAVSEFVNLLVHLQLSSMRKSDGDETRAAPGGFLFSLVTCPNYFAEVLAWIGFSIMTSSIPAVLFTLAGFYQMAVWAIKKHQNYIKEDETYKKKGRKAIIPFLL